MLLGLQADSVLLPRRAGSNLPAIPDSNAGPLRLARGWQFMISSLALFPVTHTSRCAAMIAVIASMAVNANARAQSAVRKILQSASNATATADSESGWTEVKLTRPDPKYVHDTLLALFEKRLAASPVRDGTLYTFEAADQQSLRIGWQASTARLFIAGPKHLKERFTRLVAYLDSVRRDVDSPQFVAYRNADPIAVQRLLRSYGLEADKALPTEPTSLPPAQSVSYPLSRNSAIQETLPSLPTLGESPPLQQDENQQRQESLLRELRDSVQVETLPELGIIILRGRQKEVEELRRIIEELERLSADSQPEFRIIELKHTRGDAIQKIIQTTSADLVNSRQGRATVTALIKPNALLLIGWGEAINTISDLIARLDQPVDSETQFEVFRLQEAEAPQLQTALNAFFQNREGLGPKAQVVTDARTNSLIVYAAPRDMLEVRRLIQELDVANYRKSKQARIIKVQNSLAAELATTLQNAIKAAQGTGTQKTAVLELIGIDAQGQKLLRSGVLDEVQITPNPINNSLIVSGPAESMDLIEALVLQLDVVGSTAQIKVFRIEHGDASTLVQMLRALLPEQTTAQPQLKLASGGDEVSLAPLRFSIDTRTNSIIATGSEGDLRIIEALLLRLDEREFSQRRNSVYRLKNAPASDVAQAVNNFLRSERQAQQITTSNISPFEQMEHEVVVVPEPVSNRLILSATPRYFEEIEALIQQLDEPPPQVMIQVLIAEVNLDNAKEFGIELGLQDSILFDRSLLGNLLTTTTSTSTSTPAGIVTTTEEIIQAASNDPGFQFNNKLLGNSGSAKSLANADQVAGQGLSNFGVGRINNELGFGGLVLSAGSESVNVLIRAMELSRRLEVLSRPQIRTLDNQPAFIQVGQRVPRIVGSTVNQSGQSNSITLENVGLILGVTPRISPDGTVVMEIDAERSFVGEENEGIPVSIAPNGDVIRSPRIDTTTAQATVSAASGETIILGGLITKRTQSLSRKVPVLSDIPLLGNLFRYDQNSCKRTELLIILTPFVIRSAEDEQRLKQAEFARISWCMGDVYEVHGDPGALLDATQLINNSPATETVYPDQDKSQTKVVPPDPLTPQTESPPFQPFKQPNDSVDDNH